MYTEAFVKIYNWRNGKLVNETYKMVKLEKYLILKTRNSLNLGTY